jgi:hypothetical protein
MLMRRTDSDELREELKVRGYKSEEEAISLPLTSDL